MTTSNPLMVSSRLAVEPLPIRAAALVYAEIGQKVREADHDSVTERAWTGKVEKARLLARALRNRPGAWERSERFEHDSGSVDRADRSAAFLVDAAAKS